MILNTFQLCFSFKIENVLQIAWFCKNKLQVSHNQFSFFSCSSTIENVSSKLPILCPYFHRHSQEDDIILTSRICRGAENHDKRNISSRLLLFYFYFIVQRSKLWQSVIFPCRHWGASTESCTKICNDWEQYQVSRIRWHNNIAYAMALGLRDGQMFFNLFPTR